MKMEIELKEVNFWRLCCLAVFQSKIIVLSKNFFFQFLAILWISVESKLRYSYCETFEKKK